MSPLYTVLLPETSFLIDASTRDQIELARNAGVESLTILPLRDCGCDDPVSLDPTRVLALIAHSDAPAAPENSNIVPFTRHPALA